MKTKATTEIIKMPEWLTYYLHKEYQDIKILDKPIAGNHLDHIIRNYEQLQSGESIAVIVSLVWKKSKLENEIQFNQWLTQINAIFLVIDKEVFRADKIMFATNVIIIKKP